MTQKKISRAPIVITTIEPKSKEQKGYPKIMALEKQNNVLAINDPIRKPSPTPGQQSTAKAGPVFCERILKLRFQLCLFLFFSMLFTMFNNLNLGLTLLCMVGEQSIGGHHEDGNRTRNPCPACVGNDISMEEHENLTDFMEMPRHISSNAMNLDWTLNMQWLIMSGLSWGRLIAPISGFLTDKVDNGFLMEISFLVAGICNALFPLVSSFSFVFVMALRVIIGVTDAVIQPCLNRFVAQWYSEKTRTNAYGWATAGRQLGALIVFPVSGFLCTQTQLLGGWPLVFYVSALGCCGWTFSFYLFKIIRLQKREKFIKQRTSFIISQRHLKIPWMKIIGSPVMWANLCAILCHEVPVNILFTFLPRYVRDVMKVGIQFNALLSVLPIACFLIAKIGASQLDHVLKKRLPNFCTTKLCKMFNSAASLGLGVFLMAASFSGSTNVALALTCLCLGTASAGLHTPGCLGTLVTMAPSFAGSLSGFAYFFISLTSILNPLLIGAVVVNQTAVEWSMIFKCASLIALLPLVFFNLWGSAKEQPWSTEKTPKIPVSTIKAFQSKDVVVVEKL